MAGRRGGRGVIASSRPADVSLHPSAAGGVAAQRVRGPVEEVAIDGERARGALRTAPPLVAEVTPGSVDRLGLRRGRRGVGVVQGRGGAAHGATRAPPDTAVSREDRAGDGAAPEAPEPDAEAAEPRRASTDPASSSSELPGLIIMALVLAILIKTFLFQAFFIPTGSMEPTLDAGRPRAGDKVPYYFGDPRARRHHRVLEHRTAQAGRSRPDRRASSTGSARGSGVAKPDNPDYIKRVIGLPGDTVMAKGGKVYVNDVADRRALPHAAHRRLREGQGASRTCSSCWATTGGTRRTRGSAWASVQGQQVGFIPIDKVIGRGLRGHLAAVARAGLSQTSLIRDSARGPTGRSPGTNSRANDHTSARDAEPREPHDQRRRGPGRRTSAAGSQQHEHGQPSHRPDQARRDARQRRRQDRQHQQPDPGQHHHRGGLRLQPA